MVASITWDTNTGGGVSVNDPSITRGYSVVGCRYVAGADGKIVLRTYKVNVNDTNGYHIYAPTHSRNIVFKVHTSPSFIRCQYFAHRLNLLHPRLRCLIVDIML